MHKSRYEINQRYDATKAKQIEIVFSLFGAGKTKMLHSTPPNAKQFNVAKEKKIPFL